MPAQADDFSFPSDCAAIDIVEGNTFCGASNIGLTIDALGSVEVSRLTAYPRAAFDGLITEYEGHTGTTEEYLDNAILAFEADTGTLLAYEVTDTYVSITVTYSLSAIDSEPAALGIILVGDEINAQVDPQNFLGVDQVTMTVPGDIIESNGQVKGKTATWNSAELLAASVLTLRASTVDSGGLPTWLIALIPIGLVGLLASLYFGFVRTAPPVPAEELVYDDEDDEVQETEAGAEDTSENESPKV